MVAACKFSLTCNLGPTCSRRHPNTIAEPDKILLSRLEDEAGQRLVPKWLVIKGSLVRAFGQSLREKKQKLGEVSEACLCACQRIKTDSCARELGYAICHR